MSEPERLRGHNDPEPAVCRECQGEGVFEVDLNQPGVMCADCGGTGVEEPLTMPKPTHDCTRAPFPDDCPNCRKYEALGTAAARRAEDGYRRAANSQVSKWDDCYEPRERRAW